MASTSRNRGTDLRQRVRLYIAVAGFFTAACAAPGALVGDGEPVTGDWAGDHITLSLTTVGGQVEYDCAHGSLFEPIRPDARRAFEAVGAHVRDHGGPVRIGERPDSIPARYDGTVRGARMTIRVFAGTDTLGPFALERGAAARLTRCL